MSMTCSKCGGMVVWKGPLSALTHTECTHCGAVNAQLPDEPPADETWDSLRQQVDAEARPFVDRTIAEIRKVLSQHADAVAQFAVHMQQQLDEANDLLHKLHHCNAFEGSRNGPWSMTVPADVMQKLVSYMKKQQEARNGTN